MMQFVILGNFTQKRIETIKDLQASIKESAEIFESFGVKITKLVFTMARYDVIGIAEGSRRKSDGKSSSELGKQGTIEN